MQETQETWVQSLGQEDTWITSWEIDGETVETVSDFIFLGSKITSDGDCSLRSTMRNWFLSVKWIATGGLITEGDHTDFRQHLSTFYTLGFSPLGLRAQGLMKLRCSPSQKMEPSTQPHASFCQPRLSAPLTEAPCVTRVL